MGKFFNALLSRPRFAAESEDYFARVTSAGGTISEDDKSILNSKIAELKASGAWAGIRELYIPNLTQTYAGSLEKIKYTTNSAVTPVNLGASDWSYANGFTLAAPNTNKYFNTNYSASTLPLNDLQAGIFWEHVSGQTGDVLPLGAYASANSCVIVQTQFGGGNEGLRTYVGNSNSFVDIGTMYTPGTLVKGFSNKTTGFRAYQDGYFNPIAAASRTGAIPNLNWFLGAYNVNGTPTSLGVGYCKGYFVATGLTDTMYMQVVSLATEIKNRNLFSLGSYFFLSFNTKENLTGFYGLLTALQQYAIKYEGALTGRSHRDFSMIKVGTTYWAVHSTVEYMIGPGDFSSFFTGSPYFALVKSTDLINWTFVSKIDTSATATHISWSPEWFVEDNRYYISYAFSTNGGTSFVPRYLEITTLSDTPVFTAPTTYTGTAIPANIIDPYLMKKGSTYYLWYKNETTKYLGYVTSSSPFTGFNSGPGDLTGLGVDIEGTQLILLDDGVTWHIYYDKYALGSGVHYRVSTNDWATWSAETPISPPGAIVRHGNILRK